ncbi:MAG: hypothetical protein ACRCU3_09465 [Eubacteriaceae bacterium]
MAVKGRETLESKQVSLPTLIAILGVILGYTFLYNRVISTLDSYELKTGIGVAALVIMVAAFLLTLKFITTSYEMTLTHDRLNIVRKIFFWRKEIASIPLNSKTELKSIEKGVKAEGEVRNYTLANVEGKKKYLLVYTEQGKICSTKVQCSRKFYELIKKQCKIE